MILLGIDPGLATVGWGVVDYANSRFRPLAYGAITTPAGVQTAARLSLIHRELSAIIVQYRPTVMAVEELFFSKNITTGIRVAEARGVILMTAEEHGLTLAEYTPNQVKQAVVGYGNADKQQVIAMVTRILNLPKPPHPDDTADALAIAICHAHSGCSPLAKYFNPMQ